MKEYVNMVFHGVTRSSTDPVYDRSGMVIGNKITVYLESGDQVTMTLFMQRPKPQLVA